MTADNLQLPDSLTINAWTGDEAPRSKTSPDAEDWILSSGPPRIRTFLAPPRTADPANWRDPRVGWGLVLPHNPSLSQADEAAAKDAPEPIRALLASRGEIGNPAPVFRYMPGANRVGFLHRDGSDIPVSMAPSGTGPGAIPRYLLLYGSPEQIPWQLQYNLNAVCASGRLTLQGDALENYVQALMSDWSGSSADKNSAVVWAVDHGPADITSLMRRSIAERVASKIASDTDLQSNSRYVDGSQAPATTGMLIAELVAHKPALIVTTSHGQTGPIDNPPLMAQNLGLLVDADHSLLQTEALLSQWQPGGAIWYAHACCSAGSDSQTMFDGLVAKDSPVDQILKGVAKIGARTAPLPEALLGAKQPLRAFVGHVEPTFDWTLQQRFTGQFQTAAIEEALYDKLYQPQPLGLAFRDFYNRLAGIYAEYDTHLRAFNGGAKREAQMLYNLLLARDVQTMVVLGDPTAMLPPLH
jgi:hypothetical protein